MLKRTRENMPCSLQILMEKLSTFHVEEVISCRSVIHGSLSRYILLPACWEISVKSSSMKLFLWNDNWISIWSWATQGEFKKITPLTKASKKNKIKFYALKTTKCCSEIYRKHAYKKTFMSWNIQQY